jgi:hypothetical protein
MRRSQRLPHDAVRRLDEAAFTRLCVRSNYDPVDDWGDNDITCAAINNKIAADPVIYEGFKRLKIGRA